MRLILAWQLNYRLVTLQHGTKGEVIGVLRKSGDYQYIRWLGFISRDRAKEAGKPVRLQVSKIGNERGFGVDWQTVPKGKHILGCMTPEGVFAVVEPMVRMV